MTAIENDQRPALLEQAAQNTFKGGSTCLLQTACDTHDWQTACLFHRDLELMAHGRDGVRFHCLASHVC
jgi:hypothetical protein